MARVQLRCGPGRAKQSFKDECNINRIMGKYSKSGVLQHMARYQGSYADVSDGLDYHQCMEVVLKGQEAFGSLPASIRSRFGNDPGLFLDFVSNPSNSEEMVKLGLKTPAPEPAKPAPEPVSDKPA